MNEIEQMKEERDSWRRVAERLEGEKQDTLAKLKQTEKELQWVYEREGWVRVREVLKAIRS